MSVISINTDQWPLVVQVFNGSQTDADIEQYMKETVSAVGENIKVRRFTRFEVGD